MRRGAVIIIVLGIIVVGGGLAALLLLSSGGGGGGIFVPAPPTPAPTVEPTVPVVIARFDILAGTVITDTETLLDVEDVPISQIPGEGDYFRSPLDLNGKLALSTFNRGERIRTSDITDPGLSQQIPEAAEDEGSRPKAYPLLVNVLTGVADQLKPNDTVDVVATFSVQRRVAIPSDAPDENGFQRFTVEFETFFTTKTIVQRAQVLRVLRPARPQQQAEGEEAPPPGGDLPQEGEPPPTDAEGRPIAQGQEGEPGEAETLTGGSWVVVLAVNDQEIELIEFARASNARISLALRGADDDVVEETVGASLDVLVSDFGLPLPEPLLPPALVDIEQP